MHWDNTLKRKVSFMDDFKDSKDFQMHLRNKYGSNSPLRLDKINENSSIKEKSILDKYK